MRLAAALILTLMAAGALAEEPRPVIYYGDEQGFVGEASDGNDWFQGGTRSERGVGDGLASQRPRNQSQIYPSHPADVQMFEWWGAEESAEPPVDH